jgi:hypothetical protein
MLALSLEDESGTQLDTSAAVSALLNEGASADLAASEGPWQGWTAVHLAVSSANITPQLLEAAAPTTLAAVTVAQPASFALFLAEARRSKNCAVLAAAQRVCQQRARASIREVPAAAPDATGRTKRRSHQRQIQPARASTAGGGALRKRSRRDAEAPAPPAGRRRSAFSAIPSRARAAGSPGRTDPTALASGSDVEDGGAPEDGPTGHGAGLEWDPLCDAANDWEGSGPEPDSAGRAGDWTRPGGCFRGGRRRDVDAAEVASGGGDGLWQVVWEVSLRVCACLGTSEDRVCAYLGKGSLTGGHTHTTSFNTNWVKGRIFCVGDR